MLVLKTTNANSVIKQTVFCSAPNVSSKHCGGKSTSLDLMKNAKKSAEQLNLTISQNFKSGESWVILITLKEPFAHDKDLTKNFKNRLIRCLKRYYRKNGLEFKTTGVIEKGHRGTKRWHLHLIVPKIVFTHLENRIKTTFSDAVSYVYKKRLYDLGEDEFIALAKYFLKDRQRNDEFKSSRFCHNLQKPDVGKKVIRANDNPLNPLLHTGSVDIPDGYKLNTKRSGIFDSSFSEPTGSLRFNKKKNDSTI